MSIVTLTTKFKLYFKFMEDVTAVKLRIRLVPTYSMCRVPVHCSCCHKSKCMLTIAVMY